MLQKMQIRSRIFMLVVVQLVVMIAIGIATQLSLSVSDQSQEQVKNLPGLQAKSTRLAEILRSGLVDTVIALNAGAVSWYEAQTRLESTKMRFDRAWKKDKNWSAGRDGVEAKKIESAVASLQHAFTELSSLMESQNRQHLKLFIINDFGPLTSPMFDYLKNEPIRQAQGTIEASSEAQGNKRALLWSALVIALVALPILVSLGLLVSRSIVAPIDGISTVVAKALEGDRSARTGLRGVNEVSELGRSIDNLLDKRDDAVSQALIHGEQENEALNNSVITLLQAVAQLSQRDLTVNIPVAEDVTGAVADALNLLTQEMAAVLRGVIDISAEVATASSQVKVQSDAVMNLAASEREQVLITARELNATAEALQRIARVAGKTNEAAELAIQKTKLAVDAVISTVNGINSSRDTIRETEKRIKRLGDRSQEISVAVNLINNIAERTHILALNASMHAASAGEAGRGFAVVADEVQRLAENARNATSQIANLVTSIQTETADTAAAMNAAIGQVVDGSRLAEEAGERMRETQETTAELVAAVQEIAANSQTQAQSSQSLREHARQIEASTEQTSEKLTEQAQHTTRLLEHAKQLVAYVQVFRLPEKNSEVKEVLNEAA